MIDDRVEIWYEYIEWIFGCFNLILVLIFYISVEREHGFNLFAFFFLSIV